PREAGYISYCQRISGTPPKFESVKQEQICDRQKEVERRYRIASINLADWIAGWGWIKVLLHKFCGADPCLTDAVGADISVSSIDNDWALLVVEVVGAAVLPFFYGVLGAGAAVLRNIWSRARDSLLTPRDLMLCLGQLALGAIVGACIGLFVTPTSGGLGLTGPVTLSVSAMSFIAGFGVEGVFVALEGFVKRVFNLNEQPSKT